MIKIYVAAEQDINLYVSPNTLNKSGEWVTVSWSSVSQPSTLDWVGLWVLPDNQTSIDAKTKAPVKYQVCCYPFGSFMTYVCVFFSVPFFIFAVLQSFEHSFVQGVWKVDDLLGQYAWSEPVWIL